MRGYLMMALLASGMVAAPAGAATYTITYTGTVSSSSDTAGIFGPVGGTLDGDAFKAVYTLTYPSFAAGIEVDYPGSTIGRWAISGGDLDGLPVPGPLSGKLTINGVTRVVDGRYYSIASQRNSDYGVDSVSHYVEDNNRSWLNTQIENASNMVDSPDFRHPLHYTAKGDDKAYGSFRLYNDALSHFTGGSLTVQTVDISPDSAAAVPEPATWLMMIGGLGFTGAAMRRRRNVRTIVAFA